MALDLDAIRAAASMMTPDEKRLAYKRIQRSQREHLDEFLAIWQCIKTYEAVDPVNFWREAGTDEGVAVLTRMRDAVAQLLDVLTNEGEADEVAHE